MASGIPVEYKYFFKKIYLTNYGRLVGKSGPRSDGNKRIFYTYQILEMEPHHQMQDTSF